ncbi:class I adenylate-forming enzyme family protein [Microtetraspora fusca]|uniref:Class I adenylate-forming enzyme family protein n=1 Tax=Microtetraspora fusca TaxID=1997 RepID=A0ABW6VEB1_MICFU
MTTTTALEGATAVTYGQRLAMLAASAPDKPALIVAHQAGGETVIGFGELERRSNQAARRLARAGVGPDSVVLVALPNGIAHAVASFATWKLGACVLTMNSTLPEHERQLTLAAARESGRELFVVGDTQEWALPGISRTELMNAEQYSADALPVVVPRPGTALATGGSSGRPKILVNPTPMVAVPLEPGERDIFGREPHGTALVASPMYHAMPFLQTYQNLFHDCTVVLLERFDARLAMEMIERHRVTWMVMVPTQMQRFLRVPDLDSRDFSSVKTLYHAGAVCPQWVKRRWLELLGPDQVVEAFGSSESAGGTFIWGQDWLAHPGSVGRGGELTEVRILDDEGAPVAPGEVGNIYLRWLRPPAGFTQNPDDNYAYWGAEPATATSDGAVCVGDLGWLDEDGYLFIADRRVDLIITGGQNVYPAEVEVALSEHPGVLDVVVIGLPDEAWGRRVHAIVVADPERPPSEEQLRRHCRDRMAHYKTPKTFEYVDVLPRDDLGKIRRRQLAGERLTSGS